jgi:hypothetical protein
MTRHHSNRSSHSIASHRERLLTVCSNREQLLLGIIIYTFFFQLLLHELKLKEEYLLVFLFFFDLSKNYFFFVRKETIFELIQILQFSNYDEINSREKPRTRFSGKIIISWPICFFHGESLRRIWKMELDICKTS